MRKVIIAVNNINMLQARGRVYCLSGVKAKHGRVETVPVEGWVEPGAKGLDFMEALKRSVAARAPEKPPAPPKRGRAPAKKPAAKFAKTPKAPARRRA